MFIVDDIQQKSSFRLKPAMFDYMVNVLNPKTPAFSHLSFLCHTEAHLSTRCPSMTHFTHWVLFDSVVVVVAAVLVYLPAPPSSYVLISASFCCVDLLCHRIVLNPATGHGSRGGPSEWWMWQSCFVDLTLTTGRHNRGRVLSLRGREEFCLREDTKWVCVS